ncbi:MAG TPA: hypothetical protein PLD05_03255 [Thermogutta sp.]|nr:hypothetical protein [Thermogutta sp.]
MINKFRSTRRAFLKSSLSLAVGTAAVGLTRKATFGITESARGEVRGRFVYDGQPPERKKLKVDKDVDCCGKYDIRDESLMVGLENGLANVFVYVRTRGIPIPPDMAEQIPKRVVLDNHECIFKPHCMAIWYPVQEFYIVNSDPIAQNVAFSPLGDLPANIILAPAPGDNIDAVWRFRRSQTEPVLIVCNYHPWESAYILPRDNPFFAISDFHGNFVISNVPVGEWEFQIWQERVRQLDLPQAPRGRLVVNVKPGVNDLGVIKVRPEQLNVV